METHRIEMGDVHDRFAGLWVDVKLRRSFAAQQRVDMAREGRDGMAMSGEDAAKVGRAARAGKSDSDLLELIEEVRLGGGGDPLEATVAIIESAVVDWNLVDGDDPPKKLPLGRAGVMHDDFDPDVGEQLVDAIEDYYKSLRIPEEELKS